MDILKRLFGKLKKKDQKKNEPWYNDRHNNHDPKAGTPNGEAYISPDSIVVGISKSSLNS
jgi:hypothetical protein